DLPDCQGGRRTVTLGPHDTPESRSEYDRVIGEWLAAGRRWPPRPAEADPAGISINELILAYWPPVQNYYRKPPGKPTNEVNNVRPPLRRLRLLYGQTPAPAFDSLALETLRDRMIADQLCRSRLNRDIDRIKRLFRWGASKRLVSGDVWQ